MESDDPWALLIAAAMEQSPCATADCSIDYTTTPWYADLQHLDAGGHVCPMCVPGELPRYLISVASLMTLRRELLTERIATWLSHLHSRQEPATDEAEPLLPGLGSGGPGDLADPTSGSAGLCADGLHPVAGGAARGGYGDGVSLD